MLWSAPKHEAPERNASSPMWRRNQQHEKQTTETHEGLQRTTVSRVLPEGDGTEVINADDEYLP